MVNQGRFSVLAVLVACAEVSFGQAPPPGSGPIAFNGYVRVIEGDTIEAWINGRQSGIGFIGFDAPMGNTPCGKQAINALGGLVKARLNLDEDPTIAYDARKRRMYYAYGPSGTSIAHQLVNAGLAHANGQGKEAATLAADEQDAKVHGRGCIFNAAALLPGNVPVETPVPSAEPGSPSTLRFTFDTIMQPEVADETLLRQPVQPVYSTAATTFPSGFSQDVITSGITEPTAFTFLPDGRILIAQKTGIVWVVKNGTQLTTPFINITDRVNAYWDHGLIGIAADPDFATNNYVYLLYTYENDPLQYNGTKTARLTRVTAVGDTASPFSEVTIVGKNVGSSCKNLPVGADCISSDAPTHSIGGIRFGPDKTMYGVVGDSSSYNVVDPDALRAQNVDLLVGKMFHVDTAGNGLPANPYWNGDPTTNRSKVWAYGLRNPFRYSIRPGTTVPYIGDVGWDTTEEVDVAPSGGNMGWPCYEGPAQQSGYAPDPTCQSLYSQGTSAVVMPLISYNHNGTGAAVVGGAFYTGTTYPSQYQGAYFYGDYARSTLSYLTVNSSNGLVSGPTSFTSGADGPVDIQMGPDGNLYYIAIGTGELRRIRYTLGNTPPTAVASANPTNGLSPLTVNFSSAVSTDPDGNPITFSWNFGDGTAASMAANPQHTYNSNGTYSAVLTVTDSSGASSTANIVITVGAIAPTPTITSPSASYLFKVGDQINFAGSATDPQDGTIVASGLSWQVILHHCPGGVCHSHFFLDLNGVAGGSFVVPDHGDSVYFEFILTARDSAGLTGTTSISIQPQTVHFTLASNPPGAQLVYGAESGPAPLVRTVVVGSTHTIYAPSPQNNPGLTYTFTGWSDGGAQQHNVTVGTNNVTYTAAFNVIVTPIRVNAGGPQYLDPQNNTWLADTNYSGGATFSTGNAISNTSTPALYQSERYSMQNYTFSGLLSGTYTINLKFAEIYFTAAGKRVFNVAINGQTVLSNFDIYAQAGAAYKALDKPFLVSVTNGQIVIGFTAIVDNPKISAIEILPSAGGIAVSVSPATVTLTAGQQQQFTATVTGTSNTAVTWSVSQGPGSISTSGLYTAPSTITNPQTATVKATSVADGTTATTAVVTLNPPTSITVTVSPSTATLTASQQQQFTASVTGTTNTAVTWSISQGPGSISTSGLYTAPSMITSMQTATVEAISAADGTTAGTATVTLNPLAGTFTAIRINSGGGVYTDPSNQVWISDAGFTGGSTYVGTNTITGTTTPQLYQSERYGDFHYTFNNIPMGTYTVKLKFAEIYWTAVGERVFNVSINGQAVLTNFDIVAQAGGPNIAIDRSFAVSPTSVGQISISFTTVVNNAKISAIEIVSGSSGAIAVSVNPSTATLTAGQQQQFTATVTGTSNTAVTWSVSPATGAGAITSGGLYTAPSTIATAQNVTVIAKSAADGTTTGQASVNLQPPAGTFTTVRINSGGTSFTDPSSQVWSADTNFTGGSTFSSSKAITNTTTPQLYQTERYGTFQYAFTVPNGNYTITLKFAEIYFTSTGQRVFNVSINGQAVLTNFDIVAQAGGALIALDESFPVSATNGQITISFTSVVNNAKIGAIEIMSP